VTRFTIKTHLARKTYGASISFDPRYAKRVKEEIYKFSRKQKETESIVAAFRHVRTRDGKIKVCHYDESSILNLNYYSKQSMSPAYGMGTSPISLVRLIVSSEASRRSLEEITLVLGRLVLSAGGGKKGAP